MATEVWPNPQNSMWDFIAVMVRVWRRRVGNVGPQVTDILQISQSTLSRIESGKRRLEGGEAIKLDKAWNTGRMFELLVWYASMGHDPQWFPQYIDKEAWAHIIRIFESQIIHGLLQTEDYARALITAGSSPEPEDVLRERVMRQGVFERVPPPQVTCLISQNAIEWPVGNPQIMEAQLQHLLNLSELPNVIIRVVPRTYDVGGYPGLNGSFQLMTGEDFGEVCYTESSGGGRLVSTPSDVRGFSVRFDQIGARALTEGPSRDLIRSMMEAVR